MSVTIIISSIFHLTKKKHFSISLCFFSLLLIVLSSALAVTYRSIRLGWVVPAHSWTPQNTPPTRRWITAACTPNLNSKKVLKRSHILFKNKTKNKNSTTKWKCKSLSKNLQSINIQLTIFFKHLIKQNCQNLNKLVSLL